MKIKTKELPYEEVMKLRRPEHKNPVKPSALLAIAMRLISEPDLRQVGFTYTRKNMENAGDGPWLILMNHSSFLDLEIVSKIMYPKKYNIVCTSDGFIGKERLMRKLGGIPTQKFVTDISLIMDMSHALKINKTSVLMYPEASYSFDGTATPLPKRMGVLLKRLRVPVVMITTFGSFARDPLYNNLQKRKVKVTAVQECLLTPEEIKSKSVEELDEVLNQAFSFDYFRWQAENEVFINEPFRADGLNRILFRCASCGSEGQMEGSGTTLKCSACGKTYDMDELGRLHARDSVTEFEHIPDWYKWEREQIQSEIATGTYNLDTEVDIGMMVDFKAIYMVGSGTLHHDKDGFVLNGCDGKLHYEQGPKTCYSVYSDYFWYELGDIICIGNKDCLYYCFPKKRDVVAKTRIAVEEIYKAACGEK